MLPEVRYARLLIALVRGRAEQARSRGERGASAIEWAIISAIVVTLAIVVAVKIRDVVNSRVDDIGNGAN